eukprot:gene10501-3022_t
MKFDRLFLLSFCVALSFCTVNTEENWITIEKKLTIEPDGEYGYGAVEFSPSATQITGSVSSVVSFDGYLMIQEEYARTTNFKIRKVDDISVISKHLFVVVYNRKTSDSIQVNFKLQQELSTDSTPSSFGAYVFFILIFCIAPCITVLFIVMLVGTVTV